MYFFRNQKGLCVRHLNQPVAVRGRIEQLVSQLPSGNSLFGYLIDATLHEIYIFEARTMPPSFLNILATFLVV